MGSSRWDPDEWTTHSSTVASKPMAAIYTTTASTAVDVVKDLLPTNFKFRESCDSTPNPAATPIMIGVDVTGSMGSLADTIVRKSLGTVVEELCARKPVSDPHILLMAIGDAFCGDQYPIQATQFEADTTIIEQLTRFYIEGGGGGNKGESYNLAWYFAAQRTKIDSYPKRKKKGYLFTIGDEDVLPELTAYKIKQFFGDSVQDDFSNRELLTMASKEWEIFHLIVDETTQDGHKFVNGQDGKDNWKELLGERAVILTDHKQLAEVIVSLIQVNEGADADKVASSWSGTTELVVRKAVAGLTKSTGSGSGVTVF